MMKVAGTGTLASALVLAATCWSLGAVSSSAIAASSAEEGKKIAFDRRKGNCMSCHVIEGASLPGNIGPPLIAMKARFPDRAVLRTQIWDATQKNPQSMMPPFGEHGILSKDEIEKVTDYVHSL